MDQLVLEKKFKQMGSRLKLKPLIRGWRQERDGVEISVDVGRDKKGEFFDIRLLPEAKLDLLIMDVQAKDRHLLLMVKSKGPMQKYLCGHDERHWFAAGVPEASGASNVRQAMEALKPDTVKEADDFIRQGEWFFIPQPDMEVDELIVLKNEPLQRGGNKPHFAEFLYREGGTLVYLNRQNPNGLTQEEYEEGLKRMKQEEEGGARISKMQRQFTTMMRDMDVYAKGRISHSDHATITLKGWHRVLTNTEEQSNAMRFHALTFLD